jgi:cell shape-determining protein MreD
MGYSQRRRVEVTIAREVLLALTLLGLALVQTAFLPRPLGIAPNLLLLLTVCHALVAGPGRAARWAFYGGIGLDLCAASALGSHALALLAATLLPAIALGWLSRGNWLLPLLGALLGALAYHTTLAGLTALLVAPLNPRDYAVVAAVPDTLATLVPALPVYMSMRWVEGRTRGEVPIDVY